MHTSSFWKNHFENNLKHQRIDWDVQPSITQKEKDAILYSLKAWKLGETSDGSHLLKATTQYAHKTNDLEYIEAVKLFIKEEQKHGSNLGKYIDLIGEKRKSKDWGDSLFRKIRYFNTNMELWTITVIIVESAAQLFYKSLGEATNCNLLKSICDDILIDEAHHIKFQNERLHIIFNQKTFYQKVFSTVCYSLLFFLTIHAIWFGHKSVFQAGQVDKVSFMSRMTYKFFNTLKYMYSIPNVFNKTNLKIVDAKLATGI